jgi:hypothetical protein
VLAWDGGCVRVVIVQQDALVLTVVEISMGLDAMGAHVWERVHQDSVGGRMAAAAAAMAEVLVDISGKRPAWDTRKRTT